MLNSATLTAILVNILAALFFTWWAIRVRENQFAKKMIEQAGTK